MGTRFEPSEDGIIRKIAESRHTRAPSAFVNGRLISPSAKEPSPFLGAPVMSSRGDSPTAGKNPPHPEAKEGRAPKVREEVPSDQPPEPPSREDEASSAVQEGSPALWDSGGMTAKKGKHVLHCLTIIGQIEGHYILPAQNKTTKYEHVIPQLLAVEQDPEIEGLVIILNTVGGDVEAGLAIAELLSGMKKPTVSLVLGGGHSIGVPLAVSARKSFIVPSATMTVHPVRMNGLVLGIPQTLSYFDKMQERIVHFVTDNSRITPERFRDLMMNKDELVMDVGSVLDGATAVEEGLIDSLGGISDVIAALYEMIEEQEAGR